MLEQITRLFSPADWLAFGRFLFGWTRYCYYAGRAARSERGLRRVTSHMRLDWARQTIGATLLTLAMLYPRNFRSQTLLTLAR